MPETRIQKICLLYTSPLSVILGYAGSMEEDSSLSADIRDQASMIRKQGEKPVSYTHLMHISSVRTSAVMVMVVLGKL